MFHLIALLVRLALHRHLFIQHAIGKRLARVLPTRQPPELVGKLFLNQIFVRPFPQSLVGCEGGVYIRFCGNGCLGFRSYSGSLLRSPEAGPVKSKQNAFAPPLGASLGLGMPSLRHCSVGRHEGPSMAQRGYPGIHAGMPTPQCLRSASVVNGAPRSTSTARRPNSRPDLG